MNEKEKYYGIIYKAINVINDKVYIGLTTSFLKNRIWGHKNTALKGKDNKPFYNAIRKYEWENFKWKILCECYSKEDLNWAENYFIKNYYKSLVQFNKGYNIRYGGNNGKRNNLTKIKISKAKKGKKMKKRSLDWNPILEIDKMIEDYKDLNLKELIKKYNYTYKRIRRCLKEKLSKEKFNQYKNKHKRKYYGKKPIYTKKEIRNISKKTKEVYIKKGGKKGHGSYINIDKFTLLKIIKDFKKGMKRKDIEFKYNYGIQAIENRIDDFDFNLRKTYRKSRKSIISRKNILDRGKKC